MNELRTFHLLDNSNITKAFEKQLKGCVNVLYCSVANDSFTELLNKQSVNCRVSFVCLTFFPHSVFAVHSILTFDCYTPEGKQVISKGFSHQTFFSYILTKCIHIVHSSSFLPNLFNKCAQQ